MARIETGFIPIGQTGPTVDGRRVERQELLDAAETYNPGTYAALIWPEHNRDGNNFGQVLELKAVDNGSVTVLYARLAPNASFLWEQQYDQKLFFSMELIDNFADSGRTYLGGLGATDSPACLGMAPHRFFSRQSKPGTKYSSYFRSAPAASGVAPEGAQEQAPGWFTAFLQKLFPEKFSTHEDTMNIEELLAALQARIEAVEAAVAANAAAIEALGVAIAALDAAPEPDPAPAAADAEFKKLSASLAALMGQNAKILGALAKMPAAGTKSGENTGFGAKPVL